MSGTSLGEIFGPISLDLKAGVGDNMHVQAFEASALAFIHEKRVAHRDAFFHNFLVQWDPESLKYQHVRLTHQRIYPIYLLTTSLILRQLFASLRILSTIAPVRACRSVISMITLYQFLHEWRKGNLTMHFILICVSAELDELLLGLVNMGTAVAALESITGRLGLIPPALLHVKPAYREEANGHTFYPTRR
ncbi:hypothetical protein GYMLUDRAFT_246907 [Collybiopsis luxurians FD-317 M1]|uniref:Protein kinase domain-containing protein n=1 Tax=Collybiopsis luxurians FD-317 M1 TaxID=944289 RepID=A0A0D0C555_9AGAR|nr:hypothetical protein GYMLUDRAFT_246907 [Collybiopsis luxurians FD-317 M1]